MKRQLPFLVFLPIGPAAHMPDRSDWIVGEYSGAELQIFAIYGVQ